MKTNILKETKKYIVIALFAPIFIGNTFAQKIKLEKETGYFNAIEISDNEVVNISQGEKSMVIVEGDKDAVNAYTPNIKNNVLKIKAGHEDEFESIQIVVKDLKDIRLKGASSLKGTSVIKSKTLTLTAEDASEIKLDVDVDSLKTVVEGAASIKYSGKAKNHKILIKGAASIGAYNLETENSQIDLAGAGTAQVNVKNELSGEISGLGSIFYKDDPAKVNVKTSGLGSVKKGSPKMAKSESDSESDTTRFNIGQKEIQIFDRKDSLDRKKKKDKFNGHWGGIELGVNNYLNRYNKMEVPGGYDFLDLKTSKSIGISLNIYEQNFNLYKNRFGIVSGIGLTYNNYRFTHNTTLISKSPLVNAFTDTTKTFTKNKLTVSYLTVPVILEYNTGDNHKFHIGAGMILGARLGSHIKQVYEVDGSKYQDKTFDDFNLNPYKADATVRIGVGFVNLFANYSLTPLFKKDKQPELYPLTVGLCIVGW